MFVCGSMVYMLDKTMISRIHIYDLDGTVIDSDHRYRNLPNGSIDLPYWIENSTPEKVAMDSLMPLAAQYIRDLLDPSTYVVVATARLMAESDLIFLANKLGMPDYMISRRDRTDERKDYVLKVSGLRKLFNLKQFRDTAKKFWDDNPANIEHVSKLGVESVLV